jgi:ribosomal protein S28E/S33
MDDTTRSIIRNVKGPGTISPSHANKSFGFAPTRECEILEGHKLMKCSVVREDDILCLLESEREARRLR